MILRTPLARAAELRYHLFITRHQKWKCDISSPRRRHVDNILLDADLQCHPSGDVSMEACCAGRNALRIIGKVTRLLVLRRYFAF